MLKLFNGLPQPSLQCKATKEGDVEDSVEMPVTTECPSFDGFWDARPIRCREALVELEFVWICCFLMFFTTVFFLEGI